MEYLQKTDGIIELNLPIPNYILWLAAIKKSGIISDSNVKEILTIMRDEETTLPPSEWSTNMTLLKKIGRVSETKGRVQKIMSKPAVDVMLEYTRLNYNFNTEALGYYLIPLMPQEQRIITQTPLEEAVRTAMNDLDKMEHYSRLIHHYYRYGKKRGGITRFRITYLGEHDLELIATAFKSLRVPYLRDGYLMAHPQKNVSTSFYVPRTKAA